MAAGDRGMSRARVDEKDFAQALLLRWHVVDTYSLFVLYSNC
jgi:hypothetical protein